MLSAGVAYSPSRGENKQDEEMGELSSSSYTDMLKIQLAHVPIRKSAQEEKELAERMARHEKVKPELVAATTHCGNSPKFT